MVSKQSVIRLSLLSVAVLAPAVLIGCGGLSGGSGESATFKVVSCNIGGSPCGGASNVVNQNQDLKFSFNFSVDPNSVDSNTLQVIEVDPSGGGGSEPLGSRFVTGKTVTFRPSVSIDSNGNVSYGLQSGKSYQITIPKSPAAAIRSVGGDANTVAVSTTVFVANKVIDAVPGNPQIKGKELREPIDLSSAPVSTDVVITFLDIMNVATLLNTTTGQSSSMSVRVDLDGNPATPNDQIAISGSWTANFDTVNQETTVRFKLTPGTKFPGPGPSGTRRVVVTLNANIIKDLGGNALATGIDPADGLQNPTQFIFKNEDQPCPPPVDLVEDFTDNTGEDAGTTGVNMWNPAGPNAGLLVGGLGGGQGTLGEFVADFTSDFAAVGAISTDGTSLPSTSISSNVSVPGRTPYIVKDVDSLTGTSFPVEDGIFQFSRFVIPAGVRVRFEGSKAARIFVRGNVQIDGILDVGGLDGSTNSTQNEQKAYAGLNTPCTGPAGGATSWDDPGGEPCPTFPQYLFGKPAGRGGPLAGDGGRGGDIPLNTPAYPAAQVALFTSFHGTSGHDSPAPTVGDPVATGGIGTRAVPVNIAANDGQEVFGNVNTPSPLVGGGFTYDNCTSGNCSNLNPTLSDGITWFLTGASPNSYAIHIGAPGGGGASFASDGATGFWCNETTVTANCGNKLGPFPFGGLTTPLSPLPKTDAIPYWPLPPIGVGGTKGAAVEPPDFGSDGVGNFSMLRGGAGGGGTGANAFGVASNVNPAIPLTWAANGTVSGILATGTAGGGGGGALQLQAGRDFAANAVNSIDGAGGNGGDHIDRPNCTPFPQCGIIAAGSLYGEGMCPGGAGGGGAILLQSANGFTLANNAVTVRGGIGGDGRQIELAFNTKFILNAGAYPGYNSTQRLRLRGGDGGNGRWHYQSGIVQNVDAGFDPPQAANQQSPYTGINIPEADFSGAQSKWTIIPATGAFIDVTSYTLVVKNQDGSTTTLLQDDLANNEVLSASYASGGTLPVRVFFQGTRADAFNQPDPNQRTKWTEKVTELSASSPKFVRFIVVFSRQAQVANPTFVGIDSLSLKVSGC